MTVDSPSGRRVADDGSPGSYPLLVSRQRHEEEAET